MMSVIVKKIEGLAPFEMCSIARISLNHIAVHLHQNDFFIAPYTLVGFEHLDSTVRRVGPDEIAVKDREAH